MATPPRHPEEAPWGAPIRIDVTAAAKYGVLLQAVIAVVRDAVTTRTGLVVADIDVIIDDVFTD